MSPPESASLKSLAQISIAAESPLHRSAIEALFDQGFGPGRFAKTAERLRERNTPRLELSRVALKGDEVVAAGRVWPISIGDTPALFFGPFAVLDTERHNGLGRVIIDACVEAASKSGEGAMLLIGAAPYFTPSGFTQAPKARLILPGPVDAARLLWRELRPGGLDDLSGAVSAPRAAKP